MLKLLGIVLAGACAGPLIAYLSVWAACAGADPLLGVFCGHNAYIPLAGVTALVWLSLIVWVSLRSGRRA